MSLWHRLNRGETSVDFVGKRRIWFRISLAAIAVTMIALVARGGLNLGIEFEGGVSVTGPNPAGATIEDFRGVTNEVGVDDAVIQLVNDGAGFRIQTVALDPGTEDALLGGIASVSGTERSELSIDAVGPTFGALILRQSLIALVVFLLAVTLFMTWRLELKMALAGMAALVHDLLVTTGVYALTGFEVTPATVVALLTILGYSLYDTVVVFEKVREMVGQYGDRLTYSEVVNRSMNLVLSRSLNTSLTSLLTVGSILFVGSFVLGATTLEDFALALFVGLAASTYSSIFVAAPLLATWKEKEEAWAQRRRKIEARLRLAPTAKPGPVERPAEGAAPRVITRPPPRPPKKRAR
ncbi:MAG: protein translocase subunit SecF [Acidimicrobiia bacterium]